MGGLQTGASVKFDVGQDKTSAESRIARGVKVGSQATSSPLYQEVEIGAGVDAIVSDTQALAAGMDAYGAALAAFKKARSELGVLMGNWDRSYDVLLAAGEKHCSTMEEGIGLGLTLRLRTSHVFAKPIGVTLKHNVAKNLLRIHVKRAPGTHSLSVQVSRDPDDPTGWKELDGDGAIHEIDSPSPGVVWVRAQSRSAKARSEFTTPVSIVVK